MNPESKISKLLLYLYLNKGKKCTREEIIENTGIPVKDLHIYYVRTSKYVRRDETKKYFWFKIESEPYIRKILMNTYPELNI